MKESLIEALFHLFILATLGFFYLTILTAYMDGRL